MRFTAILAAALLLSITSVQAQEPPREAEFHVSGGVYDATQWDNTAGMIGAEYRAGYNLFWILTPFVGAWVTNDNSYYGYFGLGYEWDIEDDWYLFLSTAAGGYHQGDGKDLGLGLEFRSGLEFGYEFESGNKLGVGFHHLSNASLGDKNPGIETLTLNYGFVF